MPEPRGVAGTAILFGGLAALPFALIWSALFALSTGRTFGDILPTGMGAGLCFDIFFGAMMGSKFRGETAAVDFADKRDFGARLNIATSQLGYFPATQAEGFHTYKPSFQAGLAAGRISVQLLERQAVLVGPKMYIDKLVKSLGGGRPALK